MLTNEIDTRLLHEILGALEDINQKLERMEHVAALDVVMRHGTVEQRHAARQHLLDELEKQSHG